MSVSDTEKLDMIYYQVKKNHKLLVDSYLDLEKNCFFNDLHGEVLKSVMRSQISNNLVIFAILEKKEDCCDARAWKICS